MAHRRGGRARAEELFDTRSRIRAPWVPSFGDRVRLRSHRGRIPFRFPFGSTEGEVDPASHGGNVPRRDPMDPGLPRVSDERDPNRSGFDRDLPRWDLGWDKGKSIVSGRPLPNVRESLPWKETSTTHGSIRMLGRARKRRIRGTETILDERGHGNAHDPRRKCEVDTGPCRRRERFLVRVGASFDVPITCTFGVDPVRSPPTVSPRHLLPLHPPKRQVRRVGKRLAKTDRTSLRSLGVGLGCGGVDDRWVVLPVPGQDVPIGSMGSFPSTGMLRWTRRGEGHDLRPYVREGREGGWWAHPSSPCHTLPRWIQDTSDHPDTNGCFGRCSQRKRSEAI